VIPKDTIRGIRDNAQNALHQLWQSGKKDVARDIYGGMRAWVEYGWRKMPGSSAAQLAKARSLLSGLPSEISAPISTYLATDAKSLYDAKSDGYPAPPQANPKSVGDFGKAAGAAGAGVLTDVSGFLSALTQRNTWLRVGEGVLGLLLVGIGIAAITRNTPIGSAIRTGISATPVGRVSKVLK
jgi:hypothetical protein